MFSVLSVVLTIVSVLIWIPVGLLLWIPLVARASVWSIFVALSSAVGHRSTTASTHALERAIKFWRRGFQLILESFAAPRIQEDVGAQIKKLPLFDALKVAVWAIAFWGSLILMWALTPEAIKVIKGVADATSRPSEVSGARSPGPSVTTTVLDSQTITIPPGKYWEATFTMPSDKCKLEGNLEGIAGGKRDFVVMVATGDQFAAYSGDASNVAMVFQSEQTSRGHLSVPLDRGSYHLVISNTFSTVTAKWVRLNGFVSRCDAQR